MKGRKREGKKEGRKEGRKGRKKKKGTEKIVSAKYLVSAHPLDN